MSYLGWWSLCADGAKRSREGPAKLIFVALGFVEMEARPGNLLRECGVTSSMIRKLQSGGCRLYSLKKNPKTGRRRNLGTFASLAAAKKHEREVQYFKRH